MQPKNVSRPLTNLLATISIEQEVKAQPLAHLDTEPHSAVIDPKFAEIPISSRTAIRPPTTCSQTLSTWAPVVASQIQNKPSNRFGMDATVQLTKETDADGPPLATCNGADIPESSHGRKVSLNLRRFKSPPIVSLHGTDLDKAVRTLAKNVSDLEPVSSAPVGSEEARWNARLCSTRLMLNGSFSIADDGTEVAKAYYVSGVPVGVLTMATDFEIPLVYELVTHPLSQGVGACLIEEAVSESVKVGAEGRLGLNLLNADCEKAYLALGFKNIGHPTDMALDPGKSDKWFNHDEKWKLKSDFGKAYLG